jgi:hypothetical protein
MNKLVVLRRARRRRKSGGAAMFIVAVTLGLLAAMGVYGLSATAYDVKAAGHVREATQAQHAAEEAIMLAAETLQPGTAGELVRVMQLEKASEFKVASRACRTSKPASALAFDEAKFRVAEACLILSTDEMSKIAPIPKANGNAFHNVPFRQKIAGSPGAFGNVDLWPFLRVEMTNPINWSTPAGFAQGGQAVKPPIYTSVRTTVFIELKPGTSMIDARDNNAAHVVVAGRGRLIVGPYTQL